MRFIIAIVAIVFLTGSAMAQQPYAGLQERSIKTLSDQQIADLNAGRGMGLALAAELNGYPGPIHAIELASELHLSPITLANLEVATQKIGATQAAPRATHLKYHLSTVAILTPEQVTRYNELRGYKAESPIQHHHQMHQ